MPTKEMELAATDADETEVTEVAEEAGGIRFGEDSKFLQVSINISFPFSSIVIPAGRRPGGGFFEFVRRAVPARLGPPASAEPAATEETTPRRPTKRPAA